MKPKFVIKENQDGKFEVYYVEIIKKTLRKQEVVLKPYVTYLGTEKVFPFSSMKSAIEELKNQVIQDTELS